MQAQADMAWRRRVLQEEAMMERKKSAAIRTKHLAATGFGGASRRGYPWAADSLTLPPRSSPGRTNGRGAQESKVVEAGGDDEVGGSRASSEPQDSRLKTSASSAGSTSSRGLPPHAGELFLGDCSASSHSIVRVEARRISEANSSISSGAA